MSLFGDGSSVCSYCGIKSGVMCRSVTSFSPCFDGNWISSSMIFNIAIINVIIIGFCFGFASFSLDLSLSLSCVLSGVASDEVISCPHRTVCSDTSEICGNSVADCSPTPCYECSGDQRFACINATSFAYCFGNSIATSVISSCPSKQFCDPSAISPNFCSRNPDVIWLSGFYCVCGDRDWGVLISIFELYVRMQVVCEDNNNNPNGPPRDPKAFCTYMNANHGSKYATPYYSKCKL